MQREIERKKLFESLGTQQDDLIPDMESPLPSPVQDNQEGPQDSDNNSFPEPSPDARDEVESHANAHDLLAQRSEEPNSAANHAQVEEGISVEPSIVCSESETKEVQIISQEEDNSVLEMNSSDFQEKQRVNVVQVFDDDDDEPETQVQEITIQQQQQDLTIVVDENSQSQNQEIIQVQKEIVCIDLEDETVLEVVKDSIIIQEVKIAQVEDNQQENIPAEEGLKSPQHKKLHSEEEGTPVGTTEPAETALERENTGNDEHSPLTISKDEEQEEGNPNNHTATIEEEGQANQPGKEDPEISTNLFETGFKRAGDASNQMPEESQEVPQLYQIRGLSESDAQNPIRMEVEEEAYAPNDEEDIPSPKSISSGKMTPQAHGDFDNNHSTPNESPEKKSPEIEEVIASEQESWNEVEEAYQIDMHLLQDKPTLEDVLKHLEEMKLAPEGSSNTKEEIQNEVQRIYTWKTTYQQSLEQNDGSLKQVIDEIKSMHIKVDEMEEAYQHKKNWGLWRIKLVSIAKQMKDELVPIDQVKELLDEESAVKYYKPADPFVNLLKEKYQRATQIETLLSSELTPQDLKSIVTELKHLRIQLPQESTLLVKVEINQNLQDLMDEKIAVEDLEANISNLASRFDIADQELVEGVKKKLASGKRLASQAEYLMVTKTQHTLEDLTQMVKLAKETKAENIKISGVEQMQVIIREFLVFERVREVLFYNRAITEQDLENGEYVLIEGEKVEDIVAKSEKALEGSFELSEQELEKLEQISNEVDFEELSSGLLQNFFKQLAIIVQKEKAKRIVESDHKNTEEVASFVSQIPYNPEAVRSADKEYFARIEKENKMIAQWKESVQEFLRTCPEECLLSILDRSGEKEPDYGNISEELESLDKQVKQLEEEFNKDLSSYTDLQEDNKVLKKIADWISWIYQALDLRRQIEDEQRAPDYSVLMAINHDMNENNLPLDKGLCGLISNWHDQVEKVKRDYIREYLPKRGVIRTDDVETLKVQRLGERNTGKMTITHANEMLQLLKSVENFAILSEEIEAVNFDIKSCRVWSMKVREIIGDCEDLLDTKNIEEEEMQGQRSSIVEKHHLITKKLKELKTQMIEMTLREEASEKELAAFEWMCDAAFTLVGLRREYGYEEWRRLLREEEKLEIQVSENAEKLINKIKEELMKADEIKGFVDRINRVHEDMKQREKKGGEPNLEEEQEMKVLIEDVSQMIEAFQRCKVPLREEKNSLENLHKRYHDTKARLENILSPTGKKSVLNEFAEMKKLVRRLPIRMTEEYEELNDAIEVANILESEASNPRNRSEFQAMADLVSKYKKCPVYIREIEAIEKKYQDLKSGYEKLDEQKAKVLDLENADMTYEELFDFDQALEKMPNVKFDQTLRKLKKNCFIKKCNVLKKQTEETNKRPSTTITFSSLSMLVDDGKKYREEFSDDNLVSSCTSFIQALLRRVDDRISDIRKERDEEKLENMPKIVLGYVDLSQEIIDQKASLKNLFIQTKNYQFTETLRAEEEARKVEELVKRKRGRPRKGEEKTPPKVKPIEKKSNKSKEESREREKYDTEIIRKKQPQGQEKSWIRPSQEEKPTKSIGQYFTSAPKEGALIKHLSKKVDIKNAASLIGYIRDVLESDGNYLRLEPITCSKYAKDIVRAHPDMLESNEIAKKVRNRLRRLLLQFKNASRYLFVQTQNVANIAIWLSKTPEELQAFEKKLTRGQGQDLSKTTGKQSQADDEEAAIRKKARDDHRSKSPVPQRNSQIAAALYRPSSPIPQRDSNPFLSHSQRSKKEEQTTLQGLIRKEKQNENSRVTSSSQNVRKNLGNERSSNSNPLADKSPVVERKTRIIQEEKLPEKFESTTYDPWSDRFDDPPRNPNHITKQDVKPQDKASISKIIDANPYAIKKKNKPSKEYDPFTAGNDSHDDEEGSNYNSSRGFSDLSKKRTEKEKKEAELRVQRLERIEASKASSLPEGSILKIYEGSLEHVKDNQNIKVALYTCNAKRTVVKIPELDGHLKILKKIPKENVEAYFEKTLNSREDRDLHIISGWIECSISLYQSRYEQIARDFLKNQEVGTATYGNESARIIFMHKDQLSPSWKSKLNFKTRRTSKTSNPILYFIILGKPEKYTSRTKFIAPTVEKTYEPKDFSAGKKSLEEFEQDYDKVSEGTSIEDFEPDFGVAVDDKDSLASLEDEDRAEPKKKVTIIDPKSLNTPPFGRKRKEVEFEDISDIKAKDLERKERKFPNQSYGDRLNNFNNQANKLNQYSKRGYESERDMSEETSYSNVTKKLKTELEDENDEILISKLKTMDQDEIMEYAKSIPANKRHTLINLLKTMDSQEHPRDEPAAKQSYVPHTPESKRVPWYKQVLSQSPISYPALETQNLPFIHSSQPTISTIPTQPSPIASQSRVSTYGAGLNRFSTASPFSKSLDLSSAYKPTESTTEDLTTNNAPSIHHTPIKASQGLQGHKNNQIKRDFTPNNNFQHNNNKRFQQNSGSKFSNNNSNDFNQQSRSPFNKKSFQQNQPYGATHFKGNRNLNQNKESSQFSGFQATPDLLQTLATSFNLGNLSFDQAGGLKTAMSQTKEFNSILQSDDQTIDSYFGSNTIIAQQKRNPTNFNNQRINQSQSQSGLNFLNTPLLSFNNLGK